MRQKNRNSACNVLRLGFIGVLALWLGLSTSCASDKPRPRYLQSGVNDVIRVQKGKIPDGSETIVRRSLRATTLSDDTVEKRLVTVCLHNPKNADGPKAFDIQKKSLPRFIVKAGATACARFEPTRHTLYLWKAGKNGRFSLILSSPLDLGGSDGTRVSLDWLRDR